MKIEDPEKRIAGKIVRHKWIAFLLLIGAVAAYQSSSSWPDHSWQGLALSALAGILGVKLIDQLTTISVYAAGMVAVQFENKAKQRREL